MRFMFWLLTATVSFSVSILLILFLTMPATIYAAYTETNVSDLPSWTEPFAFHEWAMEMFDILWPRTYCVSVKEIK